MTAPWNDPARPVAERVDALLPDDAWRRRPASSAATGCAPTRRRPRAARPRWRAPSPTTARPSRPRSRTVSATSPGPSAAPRSRPRTGCAHLRAMQRQVVATVPARHPGHRPRGVPHRFHHPGGHRLPGRRWPGAPTFDPELVERDGRGHRRRHEAVGVHQGLSPVLDVVRDYRWGRVEETIGEDPYLVGTLGHRLRPGAAVGRRDRHPEALRRLLRVPRGAQPRPRLDRTARARATSCSCRSRWPSREGGAASVMNSYADIDGVPPVAEPGAAHHAPARARGASGHGRLRLLGRRASSRRCTTSPRTARGRRRAVARGRDGRRAARDRLLRRPRRRRAGRRARRVRARPRGAAGADAEGRAGPAGSRLRPPAPRAGAVDLDSAAQPRLARRMAEESVVLLKQRRRPAAGPRHRPESRSSAPAPAKPRAFLGCYSLPQPRPVPLRRVRHRHRRSPRSWTPSPSEFAGRRDHVPARAAASTSPTPTPAASPRPWPRPRTADLAVVTVGDLAGLFGTGTSGEGCDVVDLSLPGVQAELVEAVLATGTPVVLVARDGRPYASARSPTAARPSCRRSSPARRAGTPSPACSPGG